MNGSLKSGINSQTAKIPEVLLNIQYEAGILLLRIGKTKELNVTSGKIYAKSVLSHREECSTKSDSNEAFVCRTEAIDASANPSFGKLSVSK